MPKGEDWSDSDEDVLSEIETSVQLGLPDGPIHESNDIVDAVVSRIGGHPVRDILRRCDHVPALNTVPLPSSCIRLSLPKSRLLIARNAAVVSHRWSCWYRCGVRWKGVPMTECFTSGVALGAGARRSPAGVSMPR